MGRRAGRHLSVRPLPHLSGDLISWGMGIRWGLCPQTPAKGNDSPWNPLLGNMSSIGMKNCPAWGTGYAGAARPRPSAKGMIPFANLNWGNTYPFETRNCPAMRTAWAGHDMLSMHILTQLCERPAHAASIAGRAVPADTCCRRIKRQSSSPIAKGWPAL